MTTAVFKPIDEEVCFFMSQKNKNKKKLIMQSDILSLSFLRIFASGYETAFMHILK